MRVTRTIVVIFSLIAMAVFGVGVASAAPSNAPKSETFMLECENGESYPIVVNGNGDFTPGHITDGNGGVVVPVAFTIEVTDPTGEVIFNDDVAKPGKMNGLTGDLIACTFEDTFEDEGGTFTLVGNATVFLTPRN